MKPTLVWCADGNAEHSRIAVEAGWEYGVRLPAKGMLKDVPLFFADQDWKKPDREKYMKLLSIYKPQIATVLDLERKDQLNEVMEWAEEAASFVRRAVIVVNKVPGISRKIPLEVSGVPVWLGYSVPTSHGASGVSLIEFGRRSVHVLGGSPQAQYAVWSRLRHLATVESMDGNMCKKMATKRCLYWTSKKSKYGHWQPLGGFDGNGPLEAVRRSLRNINEFWSCL